MNKEEVMNIASIHSMCMTYNHSYGIMTEEEQEGVRRELNGIFKHHVKPLVEKIEKLEERLSRNSFNPDLIDGIIIIGKDENGKRFEAEFKM